MNPVDTFQEAFKACLAIPSEDFRSSAEQNTTALIEAARKLDVFFLQKQLLLSDSGEGGEEVAKLRAKLRARDIMIAKYNQKLQEWKRILE